MGGKRDRRKRTHAGAHTHTLMRTRNHASTRTHARREQVGIGVGGRSGSRSGVQGFRITAGQVRLLLY